MREFIFNILNRLKPLAVFASGVGGVSTNEGTLGGGQILQVGGDDWTYKYFNESAIKTFEYYTYVKVAIILCLAVAAIMLILRILGIRSIFKGKAVSYEVEHINNLRTRDAFVLRTNKMIAWITNLTRQKGVSVDPEQRDYMRYNIERAGLKVPGGFRYYTPDEFNALTKLGFAIFLFIGILILAFVNMFMGIFVIIISSVMFNMLPMLILRSVVAEKDAEIRNNFPDLYLMIHYELMSDSGTPLATTFKSYTRITNSVEMLKFVDDCMNMFDTYGEMGATSHISAQYREVPEITRLMRLIKQQNEGANIKSELVGFREQIIKDKKFRINQRMDKLVMKARMSFNLTTIILVQAILSAMAIYLPDIGIGNF